MTRVAVCVCVCVCVTCVMLGRGVYSGGEVADVSGYMTGSKDRRLTFPMFFFFFLRNFTITCDSVVIIK